LATARMSVVMLATSVPGCGETRHNYPEVAIAQPTDAKTFIERGTKHLEAHKYDEAISDFDAAIALNPSGWNRPTRAK